MKQIKKRLMNLRRKRHPEKLRKHKLARRMRRSRRGKGQEDLSHSTVGHSRQKAS